MDAIPDATGGDELPPEPGEDWSADSQAKEPLGELEVYNPDQAQDRTREKLASGLILLLTFTVGGMLWYVGSGRLDGTSLVQTVFPSLVTLVGTALGFYFGTRSQSQNDRNNPGG